MKEYEKKRLKYESKDTSANVFKEIKSRVDQYFQESGMPRSANRNMWLKTAALIFLLVFAYAGVLKSTSLITLIPCYLIFGWVFLIIGINLGHDAAHHCLTGKRKTDDLIFELTFGFQGLSGHLWQLRHNLSHHIFPNVYGNDSDLELTGMILLSPEQKVYKIHRYQHLYAPFLYMFFSLGWIFVQDFYMLARRDHANLKIERIKPSVWVKLFFYKILYFTVFIAVPVRVAHIPLFTMLVVFVCMHLVLSLFMTFTFFISHHVMEAEYVDTIDQNGMETVPESWVRHQIVSTVDFEPESKFANFIFGGFNEHVAHHLFPEVSHIHYPVITRIIRETLEENDLPWYKSSTFFEGVVSHLELLRTKGATIRHTHEIQYEASPSVNS
jgi:linoleoyl-CoA desaturase